MKPMRILTAAGAVLLMTVAAGCGGTLSHVVGTAPDLTPTINSIQQNIGAADEGSAKEAPSTSGSGEQAAGSGQKAAGQKGATPGDAQGAAPEKEDPDLEINHSVLDYTLVDLPTTLRLPRFKSEFRVTHRFVRPLNEGDFGSLAGDFFGLDLGAQIGLEYRFAIVSGGQIGIYRTSDKTIEFFGEYNVLRQSEQVPVAASAWVSVEGTNNFKDQYSPAFGATISRELGEHGSVFLDPIWVNHSNLTETEPVEHNNTFLLGIGARIRVLETLYVVAEASPRVAGYAPGMTPVSFALEKQVGGHVFQLNFSNSIGTTIAQIARGGPEPRNWYLGFNITRKFY